MSMDSGSASAIISAVSGISGVLLGNSFAALKDWVIHRSTRQKDTAYLAIIVVSHLDRFANGCLYVALDDGTDLADPLVTMGRSVRRQSGCLNFSR